MQWPITESARILQQYNTTTTIRKRAQLILFIFKAQFLKIFVNLLTALAAETRLADGQWLEEQLNRIKLGMLPAGTRMPGASRTDG
jgi:hypothetical protein